MNAADYYATIACIMNQPINIQRGSIESFWTKHASYIIEITAFIDTHNELIANTSRNTIFSNDVNVITNSNIIIDSALTIIDSARIIINNSFIIVDSAHAITNRTYTTNSIVRDIDYGTSILHHSDTITRSTSHIFRKATDISLNHNYYIDNYDINIHRALEIKSSSHKIINKANKIIIKANNDISLANEAQKKLQAESLPSWSKWGIVVSVMCSAAILITGITFNINISSLM